MHSSTFKDQNYCAVAQCMWPNQTKVKLAYYKNQKKTYVSQGCRKVKKFGGAKGQLISECLLGVIDFQKNQQKI